MKWISPTRKDRVISTPGLLRLLRRVGGARYREGHLSIRKLFASDRGLFANESDLSTVRQLGHDLDCESTGGIKIKGPGAVLP